MADERTYTIPLRKQWLKVAHYRRAKKAVSAVRAFVQKHMKNDDVRIGRYLNMQLWSRGMKSPPHKVTVKVSKVEDKEESYIKVELVGAPEEKKVEKKEKGFADRIKEKVTGKEVKERPVKEKKEKKEKKPEVKKEEEKKEVPNPVEEKKE
ncbi:MAG: 50S ribosomal protein L31e [archaeon]